MSVFSSESSWGSACAGSNLSPINLSQSTAKQCDQLCELVMDDGMATTGVVLISDEGIILKSSSGYLGSCKFNGEGYNCITVVVNHPSHHTVENIQADGEVVAYFAKPTGELLAVSSLFRVNPQGTDSVKFFNEFIPYAVADTNGTNVSLNDWGVYKMVPPSGSYFVYDGSLLTPDCRPVKWVVFKSMINMDPNTFAYLVRNAAPGSRSIQSLGNRDVFFNDTAHLSGGPMPMDGKTYLRCKGGNRPKNKALPPVRQVDLKSEKAKQIEKDEAESKNPTTFVGKTSKAVSDTATSYGGTGQFIDFVIFICIALSSFIGGFILGKNPLYGSYITLIAQWLARSIRHLVGLT